MKKLFLLIPALVLAIAINATNIRVTTESYSSDVIRQALYYATVDTIIVADGTYEESTSNYLALDKNIVLVAEGDNAIIKTHVPFTISGGVKATIKGFKIDATYMTGYSHLIYSADASDNNRLYIDGCDIYNYTVGKAIIAARSSYKLDSLIINNCKFYNHTTRSCVFLENTENKGLIVTNSTFYNIATGTESFGAGILDDRSTTAEVRVDHCSFYNVVAQSTDFAAIGKIKSSNSIVSNCIFMMPESTGSLRAIRDVATANNCLTYNYTYDSNWGIHYSVSKNNCIQLKDPAFVNAASGDFHITDASPAHLVGSDNKSLGAKCWWPAAPETDFATAYNLVGSKAGLIGNIRLNANSNIEYYDKEVAGTAVWEVKATRACAIQAVIDMETSSASGSIFQIKVYKENGEEVGTFNASYKADDEDINMSGTVYLPKAGVYTFKLFNNQGWSSAKVEKITLSYVGGDVQAMPGTTNINEAWFSSNGTRTAGEKIVIPSGYQHEGWVKWNVSFANTANYKAKVNINCDNGHNYTVALYRSESDESPITWGEGEQTEDASPLDLGAKEVPAGNYILKVTNAVQYSHAELVSVQFVNAGGGLVNIPGDITLTEAILSSRAYIDGNGEIRFTSDAEHGHVTEESVAWRVNVSKAGYYKFTTSVNSNNGHSYLVSVYNADETVLKGSVPQSGDDIWGAPKTFSTDNIYLEEGEYRVKVQNTTKDSNGRIVSISASYEGGAVVNIPNVAIPFADAILSENATRNLESVPQEIHFGSPNASQYAQWNIHAVAGLYTFTFDVVGTNYGTYKLDILEGNDNIFTYTQGKEGSGQVTISKVFIPAEGDYVLQLANTNSGANGYLTSLAATAATDVFVLDENTEDDGSIAAAAETSDQYTFLLKRSFTADKYYTICLPVSSWDSELKLAFGADYELWQMSSATQSGDEIALNFEQITSFSAGKPYIIKPSVDIENPILYNKKEIKNYTNNNVQSFSAANFVGTFYKSEIPAGENNLYLQNNELFYNETYNTPIKGTRAWIRLKPQGCANNVKAARIVLGGKVATDISLVNGELVDGTVKTIENGQLVIIRDGVRYNVMGVKLQ